MYKNSGQYFNLHLCCVEGSKNRHRRVIGRSDAQLVTQIEVKSGRMTCVHSERCRWARTISAEFRVLGAVPARLYTLKGKNFKKLGYVKHPCINCSVYSLKHNWRFMNDYTDILKPKTINTVESRNVFWFIVRGTCVADGTHQTSM
jgi:hypothetical protein